jgi:hypothetical protein
LIHPGGETPRKVSVATYLGFRDIINLSDMITTGEVTVATYLGFQNQNDDNVVDWFKNHYLLQNYVEKSALQ